MICYSLAFGQCQIRVVGDKSCVHDILNLASYERNHYRFRSAWIALPGLSSTSAASTVNKNRSRQSHDKVDDKHTTTSRDNTSNRWRVVGRFSSART